MDYLLLQRRHRNHDRGREVWLFALASPGGTVVLRCTNNPGDLTYGGETFTAYNCGFAAPPALASDGGLPVASWRISNVLRSLQDDMAASDWYRGGTLTAVAYNVDEDAADYSTETKTLQIVNHKSSRQDLLFTLSTPGEVTDDVPSDTYGPFNCRHLFRGLRCGYVGKTIQGVTLSGANPVSIQCNTHGMVTGDEAELETVGGITPTLNGIYTITRTNDNNFTLDGTDSSDYTGPYTTGGLAGFAYCGQNLAECRTRGRSASFGACPGLHPEGMRIGV